MLPALSSGWIYKKQYDVLVDMKKTRMRPELKYAQPPAQTLLTFCAVILVKHDRFSYDVLTFYYCLQDLESHKLDNKINHLSSTQYTLLPPNL